MKNIFFALALIITASCIHAEEAIVAPVEAIKDGAAIILATQETKSGCAICPTKEETKCGVCGKPKSHDADVDDVEGQEEGDEVKCACSKPRP